MHGVAERDDRNAAEQRDARKIDERARQHRAQRDAMQDAESNESLRKGYVARDADERGARRDQRDPPPEVAPARPSGEHQAHADKREKQRDDDGAKAEPERIVVEIGADDAKPCQVERKVIHEHEADRESAQAVDRREARGRGRMRGARVRAGIAAAVATAAHRQVPVQITR